MAKYCRDCTFIAVRGGAEYCYLNGEKIVRERPTRCGDYEESPRGEENSRKRPARDKMTIEI